MSRQKLGSMRQGNQTCASAHSLILDRDAVVDIAHFITDSRLVGRKSPFTVDDKLVLVGSCNKSNRNSLCTWCDLYAPNETAPRGKGCGDGATNVAALTTMPPG